MLMTSMMMRHMRHCSYGTNYVSDKVFSHTLGIPQQTPIGMYAPRICIPDSSLLRNLLSYVLGATLLLLITRNQMLIISIRQLLWVDQHGTTDNWASDQTQQMIVARNQ